jgi:dephospho-CoA kinase
MARILALVGMCGAGKSVAARWFEDRGVPGVYFGRLTLEELERRGLPVTPENEKSLREDLRRVHGMAAFAILSIPKIRALLEKAGPIYIDGLYSWEEFLVLKKEFGPVIRLIHIWTDRSLRYARLAKRPERPLDAAQAESRDLSEIENLAKGGPIAYSDVTVLNHGTPEELGAALGEAVARLAP